MNNKTIDNEAFADEIIRRLNGLIVNDDVRSDLKTLLELRVPCSQAMRDHETIQVVDGGLVGLVGVLNGVTGTIEDGAYRGWGYIAAVFDDDGTLMRFERTDAAEVESLSEVPA